MPSLHNLESVNRVPDTHVWAPSMINDYPFSVTDSVPIIDLSSSTSVAEIGSACESWGAFQVVGHGVPVELLDELESVSRRLFCLPMERKIKAAKIDGSMTGYGLPPISNFFSKMMWSEGFTILGSPVDDARKLWPDDYNHFCEVIEKYTRHMKRMSEKLMQLMLLSLGLTKDFTDTTAALQLNSYPACPEPDRAMGLAAHTDSGLLTILHQSDAVSGLHLLHSDRWAPVKPLRGALIVIVGDLGHVLSNGKFRSVLHRAVVNRTHHRISAAYICGPHGDVKVDPVGSAAAYRGVTWREYLGLRAKFFDKALSLIKITEDDCNKNNGVACV